MSTQFSSVFDPIQHALNGPFGCILNMPTGSGKTWRSLQAIKHTLSKGFRAVYVTPLRALADELAEQWTKELQPHNVGIFTGDYGTGQKPYPVSFAESRLLIMTPERLDACTRNWRSHWKWIPDVNHVIVDEVHLLGEPNRGARLEGAISRFRRLNPFAKITGLSATIGNPHELAKWLESVTFITKERPVPLSWKIVRYRKATEKPEKLLSTVQQNVDDGGASLVFVQSRRRAEELAGYLTNNGLHSLHHHAGLTPEQRRSVESEFRKREIKVLVSTATLEMGLNLPVRQVVLYDIQSFNGKRFAPLSTNTVWQRVGRAGRRGLDESGEAVLMAPVWDKNVDRYELGQFENIDSQFSSTAAMSEQILAEVTSSLARTRSQVADAIDQSFFKTQKDDQDLSELIDEMCDAKLMVEAKDENFPNRPLRLKPTRLGRIAVRHMLSPASVLKFQQIANTEVDMTIFDLLLVVASSSECEPVVSVDFEELDNLAACVSLQPSRLLNEAKSKLDAMEIAPRRLLSALKMACMMRTWTKLNDTEAVADIHVCYPFEVARLRDSMSRLLLAFSQVLTTPVNKDELDGEQLKAGITDEEVGIPERAKALASMVSFGLDELAVTLTFLPGLGGTLARRLKESGIGDIEEFAMSEVNEVSGIKGISIGRAAKWIEESEELVKSRHAFSFRESEATNAVEGLADQALPAGVDPYRFRRALDLTVKTKTPTRLVVTGGLEPHTVTRKRMMYSCDCVDFRKGNTCKHILATRLAANDSELCGIAELVANDCDPDQLSLFDLWFQSESAVRRGA